MSVLGLLIVFISACTTPPYYFCYQARNAAGLEMVVCRPVANPINIPTQVNPDDDPQTNPRTPADERVRDRT